MTDKPTINIDLNQPEKPHLEIMTSRHFPRWLFESGGSLAFTTYQTGKLFFVGLQPNGRLSIFERTFSRAMGLWGSDRTLFMSTIYQLWRFENTLADGQQYEGYDHCYVPRIGYTTGDLDIHDIMVDADGQVVFVNTLFSCLATVSQTHSFEPLWKPNFISRLAPEDRCHLNGLAMRNGRPAFATCVSQSDVADGWRDHRVGGGLLLDIASNSVAASGLSMPHSPRWYNDRLYLLNAGTGEFGTVDLDSGQFEPIAFCPGFLRGLTFVGRYAIVGTSRLRKNKTFSGLPLDDRLSAKHAEARTGLHVIDLATGDIVHWLRIEGIVEELYDVVALPGTRRPMALGFKTDEIRRVLTVGPTAPLRL